SVFADNSGKTGPDAYYADNVLRNRTGVKGGDLNNTGSGFKLVERIRERGNNYIFGIQVTGAIAPINISFKKVWELNPGNYPQTTMTFHLKRMYLYEYEYLVNKYLDKLKYDQGSYSKDINWQTYLPNAATDTTQLYDLTGDKNKPSYDANSWLINPGTLLAYFYQENPEGYISDAVFGSPWTNPPTNRPGWNGQTTTGAVSTSANGGNIDWDGDGLTTRYKLQDRTAASMTVNSTQFLEQLSSNKEWYQFNDQWIKMQSGSTMTSKLVFENVDMYSGGTFDNSKNKIAGSEIPYIYWVEEELNNRYYEMIHGVPNYYYSQVDEANGHYRVQNVVSNLSSTSATIRTTYDFSNHIKLALNANQATTVGKMEQNLFYGQSKDDLAFRIRYPYDYRNNPEVNITQDNVHFKDYRLYNPETKLLDYDSWLLKGDKDIELTGTTLYNKDTHPDVRLFKYSRDMNYPYNNRAYKLVPGVLFDLYQAVDYYIDSQKRILTDSNGNPRAPTYTSGKGYEIDYYVDSPMYLGTTPKRLQGIYSDVITPVGPEDDVDYYQDVQGRIIVDVSGNAIYPTQVTGQGYKIEHYYSTLKDFKNKTNKKTLSPVEYVNVITPMGIDNLSDRKMTVRATKTNLDLLVTWDNEEKVYKGQLAKADGARNLTQHSLYRKEIDNTNTQLYDLSNYRPLITNSEGELYVQNMKIGVYYLRERKSMQLVEDIQPLVENNYTPLTNAQMIQAIEKEIGNAPAGLTGFARFEWHLNRATKQIKATQEWFYYCLIMGYDEIATANDIGNPANTRSVFDKYGLPQYSRMDEVGTSDRQSQYTSSDTTIGQKQGIWNFVDFEAQEAIFSPEACIFFTFMDIANPEYHTEMTKRGASDLNTPVFIYEETGSYFQVFPPNMQSEYAVVKFQNALREGVLPEIGILPLTGGDWLLNMSIALFILFIGLLLQYYRNKKKKIVEAQQDDVEEV
ncbi:MAG: hypothetical protein LBV67_08725, partial [Streptococcaceae bacterium]|nr:hypothetical protein [Streptococcaceae bacterium]